MSTGSIQFQMKYQQKVKCYCFETFISDE